MNIIKSQFKQELWKYGSFVYIGILFLLLVFMGFVEGIKEKNILGILLGGFFTISWIYIMYESTYNIFSVTNAIIKKKENVTIKKVILVTSISNRTINKREFKLVVLFVTICYITFIILGTI